MPQKNRRVIIDYTYRTGERVTRLIIPIYLVFGGGKEEAPQWGIMAEDVDMGELAFFAMKGIHSWKAEDSGQ